MRSELETITVPLEKTKQIQIQARGHVSNYGLRQNPRQSSEHKLHKSKTLYKQASKMNHLKWNGLDVAIPRLAVQHHTRSFFGRFKSSRPTTQIWHILRLQKSNPSSTQVPYTCIQLRKHCKCNTQRETIHGTKGWRCRNQRGRKGNKGRKQWAAQTWFWGSQLCLSSILLLTSVRLRTTLFFSLCFFNQWRSVCIFATWVLWVFLYFKEREEDNSDTVFFFFSLFPIFSLFASVFVQDCVPWFQQLKTNTVMAGASFSSLLTSVRFVY